MSLEGGSALAPTIRESAVHLRSDELADVSQEMLIGLWTGMCLVREFEEMCIQLKKEGLAKGPLHLCVGQEAVGIGATMALRRTDVVTSTHRGHAHYLGKGADPNRIMAEILGRATGYGKGRAGHMLIADVEMGLIGGSGVVGGMIPVAVGQAFAFQVRCEDRVVLCFFGDGAISEGAFNEGLNLAALWMLPVVFLCENNAYGLTVPLREHLAGDITARALGYGIPGVTVDGNDAVSVWRTASEAVDRARRGAGPTLIEARTYRMTGFSTSDHGGYQPDDELQRWRARDPILLLEHQLLQRGTLTLDSSNRHRAAAKARIQHAREYAEQSPFPDPLSVEEDLWTTPG